MPAALVGIVFCAGSVSAFVYSFVDYVQQIVEWEKSDKERAQRKAELEAKKAVATKKFGGNGQNQLSEKSDGCDSFTLGSDFLEEDFYTMQHKNLHLEEEVRLLRMEVQLLRKDIYTHDKHSSHRTQ